MQPLYCSTKWTYSQVSWDSPKFAARIGFRKRTLKGTTPRCLRGLSAVTSRLSCSHSWANFTLHTNYHMGIKNIFTMELLFPYIWSCFPFCFFSKPVKMSIKGYNYVVSLIAYLKQNLQGFNARFEKGVKKEIGILMDTILKMNLFWGQVSLGHGTERVVGEVGSAHISCCCKVLWKMRIVGPFLLQQSNFGEFDLINH